MTLVPYVVHPRFRFDNVRTYPLNLFLVCGRILIGLFDTLALGLRVVTRFDGLAS